MSLEIGLGTPLAEALNAAILPKLLEVGWGTGGSDDSALAEYIILMLVNGKTQDQIAAELSGDLLNLPLDDPVVHEFSKWLFEQVHILSAPNGQQNGGESMGDAAVGEMDTDMGSHDVSELNAPTGPRSMRNGNFRGGRDKRMFGQMSKAMDRSNDNVLHRVRGQTGGGRIDTHARAPPTGPRGGRGGMMRNHNNINNNRGMAGGVMPGAPGGPGFPQWQMQGQPNQLDVMAILEQQSQMMLELSQQMMNNGNGNRGFGQQRRGKSLFERTQDPRHKNNFRRGQGSNQADSNGDEVSMETAAEGEDVDMGKREPPNPDDTICKYNLRCTNKDCNFAHQSPAAPPGVSVDVNDACGFGAACKNRKCVGRHPSPAARLAHQSEQDCKFFPNCQNARCPFKHPSMPLCRNGADCTTANCKFTHVKTKCKFNPCLNPTCAFAHEEGQQGGFKDKVWTPEQGHVSERKFVDDEADEDFIHPFAPGTPTLEDMVQNEVIG